jgi:hypothetical protein
MRPPRSTRCPRCGFSFAWDGRKCGHCPPPARARWWWDHARRLGELLNPTLHLPERPLLAFAVVCSRRVWALLTEPAQEIVGAIEVGVDRDRLGAAVRGWEQGTAPIPFWSRDPLLHANGAVRDFALSLLRVHAREWSRAAFTLAERCRRATGFQGVPAPKWEDVSLPRELEGYRAGVVAMLRTDSHHCRELLARPEGDPQRTVFECLTQSGDEFGRRSAIQSTEEDVQCDFYRDIFGYPEAAVAFDPAWRTSTAVALARGMYESRDFSPMPILADALQDAGCEEPEVLEHCRADKPHVRGCWVCEAVLGLS